MTFPRTWSCQKFIDLAARVCEPDIRIWRSRVDSIGQALRVLCCCGPYRRADTDERWQLEQRLERLDQHIALLDSRLKPVLSLAEMAPEFLIAEWNRAVVALGQHGRRIGSGFALLTSFGIRLVTAFHVLLDCGWDAVSGPLIDVGVGATITHDSWPLRARVLAHSPSPHMRTALSAHEPHLDLALLKLIGSLPDDDEGDDLNRPLPYLEASDDVRVGDNVVILGYGMQSASQVQNTMRGSVACIERVDERFGCRVIDIQGDMLSGHSGGPVVSLRTRRVIGVCLCSQSEQLDIFVVEDNGTVPAQDHHGRPMRGRNSVGGLHVAMPIAELSSLR